MLQYLLPAITSIIDKVIPDPKAKAEAQLKLLELAQSGALKELDASMQVVVAEAKSEHVLTATWRPITMLTFVLIIANNYIVYPYISLFWVDAPLLEIPNQMWALLNIGIGGYVVSRGAEKVTKIYKETR
jgi:predicted MFS family arabinose efflux permease